MRKIPPPKYKIGDVTNGNREIVKFITSLGKIHIYRVKCQKCGNVITMSEVSIKAREKCRVCYRKGVAKKSFNSIRTFGIKK